jgi:hypothetical protein
LLVLAVWFLWEVAADAARDLYVESVLVDIPDFQAFQVFWLLDPVSDSVRI